MAVKKATPEKTTKKPVAGRRKKAVRKEIKPRGNCFVMMPFGGFNDDYFKLIYEPAVKTAKLKCIRGDSIFRSSSIMSDIWSWVQEADVLLADLTGKNPNVFYELGLAHAIGKPVVLVSETMDDVPFDLKLYRVINYDKNIPDWNRELKKNITSSLNETMENPTEVIPDMFKDIVPSQAPQQDEIHTRLNVLERAIKMQTQRADVISTNSRAQQFRDEYNKSRNSWAHVKNQDIDKRIYEIIEKTGSIVRGSSLPGNDNSD